MQSSRPNCENINYGVVVAGTVPQDAIGKISRFGNRSPVVCYPKSTPCTRNTFTIKSADYQNRDGNNLLFGQEFILQLTDSPGEDLYLRSPTPLVDDTRGPRQHNRILLSNIKDCYSIWKVLCWDNKMRFETEGSPFPSSTRVVITHMMTGECLAVEGSDWYTSIFGNECGISVHTYRDIFKRETAECLWMFITEEIPRCIEERCE
ncbi:cilia- and flagella-associated protein 161-like isoform X2 [Belonocnema kinseyi]|nr:cilia- and flagella-associated protein 161-like isoform X2 [Belonocnema kinseyi]